MLGKKFKIVLNPLNNIDWIVQYHYQKTVSALGDECEIVLPARTEEDVARATVDADVIYGKTVTRKIIVRAKKLKLIQTFGSGTETVDLEAAAERGIPVSNVKAFGFAVANTAVALLLALTNRIVEYDRGMREGRWEELRSGLRTGVKGRTLGIVGFGKIGSEVADRMKPFGVEIIAIKKHPDDKLARKFGLKFLGGPDDLDHVMAQSDFVVVTLRVTDETIGMISEEKLRKMKNTAFIVNVSRGEVIDEDGLYKVLAEKKIAGAGLDVLEKEPPDPNTPLLKLDNVILTPHIGGKTEPSYAMMSKEGIDNIKRVLRGERPQSVVSLEVKKSAVVYDPSLHKEK
jgi:D-3-phosphoglycerate dehydrogenase